MRKPALCSLVPMHGGYLRRRLLSSHLALGLVEQCHAASRTLTDCNE